MPIEPSAPRVASSRATSSSSRSISASPQAMSPNDASASPVPAFPPTSSPPLRPQRDPVRIQVPSSSLAVPAPAAGSVNSAAAQAATARAARTTDKSRLLDDDFKFRSSPDSEEDDEEDPAEARSNKPFIQHSYQAFPAAGGSSEPGSPSEPSADPNSVEAKSNKFFTAMLLPCAIILSVANSITWKRMLNRYASVDGSHRNMEFFVNQWTLVLYMVACGGIFLYRWFFTDLITPEQRAYPKKRFITMGALDAVAGLFGAVGGSVTAGQVQIVINQANIPITMLFSRIYLHVTNYQWTQYLGAGVIIAGGLISALGTGADESQHTMWYGSLLIFLAVIPGSMSNVYKEENFKEFNLDVFYLSTYVSLWQGILSFACIPLFTLSYFGGIPLEDMPQNLVDGYHCFLGHHIEGYMCEIESPSSANLVFAFVFANFLYNLALLSMVKHGSALFLVIACAMALPITNLVFTQEWVMGQDVESFSVYNMIGLLLVVVGFLLYSLVPDAESGEFLVPTGPAAGHSMLITEYYPSVEASVLQQGQRRHSFDFHSSPSVRSVHEARKKRVKRMIRDKTPSRTP